MMEPYSLWVWARSCAGDVGILVTCILLTIMIILRWPRVTFEFGNFGIWWIGCKIIIGIFTATFSCFYFYQHIITTLSTVVSERPWWISMIVWIIGIETGLECVWRVDRWNLNYDHPAHLIVLWVRRIGYLFFFTYVYHPLNVIYKTPLLLQLLHHILLPLVMTIHSIVGVRTFHATSTSLSLFPPIWTTSWLWRQIILAMTHIVGIVTCLAYMLSNHDGLVACWPLFIYHALNLIVLVSTVYLTQSIRQEEHTNSLNKNQPSLNFTEDFMDEELLAAPNPRRSIHESEKTPSISQQLSTTKQSPPSMLTVPQRRINPLPPVPFPTTHLPSPNIAVMNLRTTSAKPLQPPIRMTPIIPHFVPPDI